MILLIVDSRLVLDTSRTLLELEGYSIRELRELADVCRYAACYYFPAYEQINRL